MTTGVVHTGSHTFPEVYIVNDVNNAGGQFSTGINNASGNFPTVVIDTDGQKITSMPYCLHFKLKIKQMSIY